jgi:hypothetical protein
MRFWKPRKIQGHPRVGVAVAAYLNDDADGRLHHALLALVHSIHAQTYRHVVMTVVHDGPYTGTQRHLFQDVMSFVETETRTQKFGHPHRQAAVEHLLGVDCDWILLTNQDNYYAPVFLEALLAEAQKLKVPFVYCDFVRSHQMWMPFTTRAKKGHLDLGGFLAHKSIVSKIKFDKATFNADGDYIERLVQAARARVAKVSATLYVHN